jgi:hypothetical protein
MWRYLLIALLVALALNLPFVYLILGLAGLDLWFLVLTPITWLTHSTLQPDAEFPLKLFALVLSIALYTLFVWGALCLVHRIKMRRNALRSSR